MKTLPSRTTGVLRERERFEQCGLVPVVVFAFGTHMAVAVDVVLAVAEVWAIVEGRSGDRSLVAGEPAVTHCLVHAADSRSDIFEFFVDTVGDFRQTDDEAEDDDRRDQHQFGRDDETGFVLPQAIESVHVSTPGMLTATWLPVVG